MTQPVATFENRLAHSGDGSEADQAPAQAHTHDHGDGHTHDHGDGAGPDEHGHTHEHLEHAGQSWDSRLSMDHVKDSVRMRAIQKLA